MGPVVVGVDESDGAARALRFAAREAELHQAPLVAVLAWGFLDQHRAVAGAEFDPHYGEADARAALDGIVAGVLGADAAERVERRTMCDLAARALLEASEGASLLVVGARGLGGFKGLVLGSVSQHVLHHARCPVAIVHGDDEGARGAGPERVVVGVDGSEASDRALAWALDEGRLRRARVDVVYAWQLPYIDSGPFAGGPLDPSLLEEGARQALDAIVDRALAGAEAVTVERVVVAGPPAAAILDVAAGAAIVVVGRRGRGGFKGLLLGSVSNQVTHHAPCPVVVLPAH
jgi:nucleotide-binding universal stress UspA family protein